MKTIEERLWPKVRRGSPNECWPFVGATNGSGYGRLGWIKDDGTKTTKPAHRIAYELEVGPIPDGKVLDHLCRNPPCCNPAHLDPVTRRVNTLRGINPPAFNAVKTHCKRGHLLDEANTYIQIDKKSGRPGRSCKTCRSVAYAEWIAKNGPRR